MGKLVLVGLVSLAVGLPAAAAPKQARELGGRIDDTFPPLEDVRRPDRTVELVEGGAIDAIAYAADGRTLATAGRDRRDHVVRLWSARTGDDGAGEILKSFVGHAAPVVALGFRGNLLVSVAEDGVLNQWEVATGKVARTFKLEEAIEPDSKGKRPPLKVALRPGVDPLLVAARGQRFSYIDAGAIRRTVSIEGATIECLAFAPDGKQLLVGTSEKAPRGKATGELRLYDFDKRALVRTIAAGGPVGACALSATHLAAVSGAVVKLWPMAGEDSARVLSGHSGRVNAVTFAAKGGEVATGGDDRAIRVYDVASGALLAAQRGHGKPILALAFNPNGQKMASGGGDRTLRFWTVPLPPLPAADLERITAALPQKALALPKRPRKLLVFWRADAILHKAGVPAANEAIELIGKKTGAFSAYFSRDYEIFDPKILAGFDALVLNSTAHIVLPDDAKKKAFLDYVKAGKGVVGIHAAIDMWKKWPEGAEVVGATFAGHPWSPSGTWAVKLEEPHHPLLRAFGGRNFRIRDEFYELGPPYGRADRRVLLSLDLNDGPTANVKPLHRADRDFAVSWVKRYGQGRIFYCMFGHIAEPFGNRAVLQYYLDGIQYALGDLEIDASPRPAR